jgi:hypothetical protein
MKSQTSFFGIAVFFLSLVAMFGSFGHALYHIEHSNVSSKTISLMPTAGSVAPEPVNGKFIYAYVLLHL